MWINHFQSQNPDSFLIDVTIHSPNPFFIFQKKENHFTASVSFKLSVINTETDSQVYHQSWTVDREESFYEDTRNPNIFIKTRQTLELPKGKYLFSVMIIDNDSKHEWKKNQTVELIKSKDVSDILPMIRVNGEYKFAGDNIELNTDTVYLKIQAPDLPRLNKSEIEYTIKDTGTEILSDKVLIQPDNLGFIIIPVPVDKDWMGLLEFEIKIGEKITSSEIGFVNSSLDRYFRNIEMLMNVMSVILPYKDYKDLKKLSPLDQKTFLYDYWKSQDPTPDTEENELLNEFFIRVEYANAHFGVLSPGWKSDRGMVYIQYGKPESVEITTRDNYGRTFEIWNYSSNKKFIFIDDGFGDYRLYRQSN